MPIPDAEEKLLRLATLAVQTLDAQAEYFKTRDKTLIAGCKVLERDLRNAAGAVLFFQVKEVIGAQHD